MKYTEEQLRIAYEDGCKFHSFKDLINHLNSENETRCQALGIFNIVFSEAEVCCDTCKYILPEQRCSHPQGCEADYELWEQKTDC